MDTLRVYLSNYMVGKYVVFFLDKRNKMINFDLLLGVILSQICNYIPSSLNLIFLLMSVILNLINNNMLCGESNPDHKKLCPLQHKA